MVSRRAVLAILLVVACFILAGVAFPAGVPTPDHVIVVVEENHSYSEIIGSIQAPYINALAKKGALFTNSYALTHPSQPNYLALFSGSTQGITDDSCPHTFTSKTLESVLLAAGKSSIGYAEGLPSPGSLVCSSGYYVRKHAPWTDFSKDKGADNQPFTIFPSQFSKLPTISWVIPDLLDDMHDGSIQEADIWLQNNLAPYVKWAKNHNSLLIVTWDEDDDRSGNHIATIFAGSMVKPGKYEEKITHYNVLRTLEDMYGLPHLGNSDSATPITDVWQ
jgi:phosphatidylinositol-3-phosphatase